MTSTASDRVNSFAFKGKFIITAKLVCLTGIHIGGTSEGFEIGGVDNPVIRDPLTDMPYIPGSSLKGKMRHLLEWAIDAPAVRRPHPKHGVYTACHCGECVSCKLFGVSSDESEIREKAGPARLTVRDAFPCEGTIERWRRDLGENVYTELKSENFINRLTAEATPRTLERVPANSAFKVEMIFDVYDGEGDRELMRGLLTAMLLLEHSALGGSGSRGYGEVRFEEIRIEWFPVSYYTEGEPSERVKLDGEESFRSLQEIVDGFDRMNWHAWGG